ncbi:hypothetical protein IB227_17175 [Stenotrophomonas sp. STM01]|uniref:hypothetical protein n=1 Tax=Stenotrophomonas sp. STM01 TaxID=2769278 RepID=UPI001786B86F|nr:hypothetical protein [Stenotrophomonas sp. STM01]MBD9537585.1 hypothetical protein [Stenotrophomonas sp. STM01]
MSLEKLYTKTFAKETNYFTHWLPSAALTLGTVGSLDGYMFVPKSTLQDMGIAFNPLTDVVQDLSPTPMNFTSSKGVGITVQTTADTKQFLAGVPVGKAGLGVQFSKKGSFVLRAAKAFEPRIRDVHRIEMEIMNAFKAGKWPRDYVVITQLWHAPYMDAFISDDSNASCDLQLDGDAGAIVPELGNASAKFSLVRSTGKVISLLGCQDVHPAFLLSGLKSSGRRLFHSPNAMHADGLATADEVVGADDVDDYSFGQINPVDLDG